MLSIHFLVITTDMGEDGHNGVYLLMRAGEDFFESDCARRGEVRLPVFPKSHWPFISVRRMYV